MRVSGAGWPRTRSITCVVLIGSVVLGAARVRSRVSSAKAQSSCRSQCSPAISSTARCSRARRGRQRSASGPSASKSPTCMASASALLARPCASSRSCCPCSRCVSAFCSSSSRDAGKRCMICSPGHSSRTTARTRRPAWVVAAFATRRVRTVARPSSRRSLLPAYQDYTIRAQVTEGLSLATRLSRVPSRRLGERAARLRGPDVRLGRHGTAAQRPLRRVDRNRLGHDRHQLRRSRERCARRQRPDDSCRRSTRSVARLGVRLRPTAARVSKPYSKDTPATRPSRNATFRRCAASTRHEKPIVHAPPHRSRSWACGPLGGPRTASRRTSSRPSPSSACCCGSSPPPLWWAIAALTIAFVLAAELFNTAVEGLADHLHPDQHPAIKAVKDCAAAAVLVASAAALAVAAAFVYDFVLRSP